jgi:hypothetical protein
MGDGVTNKNLYPLGGCHVFFNRLRITCGSETIEDISEYARVHEMFHVLSASDSRSNDYAEGFGNYLDDKHTKSNQITKQKPLVGIPPTESMTVFKPLSGLLRQKSFIPLQYVPLKIELSLVGNVTDPIISGIGTRPLVLDGDDYKFYTNTVSINWYIKNPQIKCDLLALDGAMQNTFDRKLANGHPLQINYNTFYSQIQTVTGQSDFSINISRSVSRLKSVFVSLIKNQGGPCRSDLYGSKSWNTFSARHI